MERSGPRREVKAHSRTYQTRCVWHKAAGKRLDGVDARALPAQVAAEMERLVVYADAQERKVSQLQAALDSRVVIEQAIGILAGLFVLPFAEAFEVIRAATSNSRREVRAVAEA